MIIDFLWWFFKLFCEKAIIQGSDVDDGIWWNILLSLLVVSVGKVPYKLKKKANNLGLLVHFQESRKHTEWCGEDVKFVDVLH